MKTYCVSPKFIKVMLDGDIRAIRTMPDKEAFLTTSDIKQAKSKIQGVDNYGFIQDIVKPTNHRRYKI